MVAAVDSAVAVATQRLAEIAEAVGPLDAVG